MTSRHSKQKEDNSMYSQLDFHARIYQLQEERKVLEKESDQDCSTKASGYLGKFDLDSPYLKTLEIYSLTKTGRPSKKSSFKLPKQGTMRSGQLYRQEIWEPVILEKESGSLPTPTARDWKDGSQNSNKNCKKMDSLGRKIHYVLPTPTAVEHKATAKVWKNQSGNMLSSIARRGELSPPTGQDMFLNPAFVEEMMGYEVGWLV
jgi:hypothetical protein